MNKDKLLLVLVLSAALLLLFIVSVAQAEMPELPLIDEPTVIKNVGQHVSILDNKQFEMVDYQPMSYRLQRICVNDYMYLIYKSAEGSNIIQMFESGNRGINSPIKCANTKKKVRYLPMQERDHINKPTQEEKAESLVESLVEIKE